MCDEWMPVVQIPMSIDHFHQLPRHPAYKYEFLGGQALLTPRAKFYHARLVLSRFAPGPDLEPREPLHAQLIRDEDFPGLKRLFRIVFRRHQPFASLDGQELSKAADYCLDRTRTGGDGPWLRQASFLVRSLADPAPVGAILVTLLPEGDALDAGSYYWPEPAPADLIEQRGGRAHLTWIFVHPWLATQGAGTLLLREAVSALLDLGYAELFSTFLLGNESSMMWHWRNGFELLSSPFSVRRRLQTVSQMANATDEDCK
jgi:hypothetical protein